MLTVFTFKGRLPVTNPEAELVKRLKRCRSFFHLAGQVKVLREAHFTENVYFKFLYVSSRTLKFYLTH